MLCLHALHADNTTNLYAYGNTYLIHPSRNTSLCLTAYPGPYYASNDVPAPAGVALAVLPCVYTYGSARLPSLKSQMFKVVQRCTNGIPQLEYIIQVWRKTAGV